MARDGDGYTVSYAGLGDLAQRIRGNSFDGAEVVAGLRAVQVPAEAFGRLGNSGNAHQACQQTVRTETDRVLRQVYALADVGDGVAQARAGYRGADHTVGERYRSLDGE